MKSQKLQDEIDELKVERDGLAKKANTIDKYKQKLLASQGLEKENEQLRGEIEEIRQSAKDTANDQQQLAGLQLTIDEYKRTLPRIEQDCHELQMMKKQLEFDNSTLAQRWEEANEQHDRDQETIAELSDKLRDIESGQLSPMGAYGGLDAELAESMENESKLQVAGLVLMLSRFLNKSRKARISELETENAQLKANSPAPDAQSVMLQQMLEDAYEKHDTLENRYRATYDEKLLLKSALQAVEQGAPADWSGLLAEDVRKLIHSSDSSEDMKSTQGQLVETRRKLAEREKALADTAWKLNDSYNRRRSLEALHFKVVEEHVNQFTALRELEDHTSETNKVLQKMTDNLEHELKGQKRLLRDARAADKQMSKNAETSNTDLRKTLESLELVKAAALKRSEGPPPGSSDALENLMADCADKIIGGADALAKRTEVHKTLSLEPSDNELPLPPNPLVVPQRGVTAPALSARHRWSRYGWGS